MNIPQKPFSLHTTRYLLPTCLFLAILLSGCAGTKEVCKGILGVSTQVLEDGRKDALKKEFGYDLVTCHNRVRAILKKNKSYIYADNLEKDMLALYISEEDTTPVGIFFTEKSKRRTLVEVASPSTYGKELIAKIVFNGLTESLTPKSEKGKVDAAKTEKVGK
ncbi:MAG: hypothetical protein KA022_00250 [Candidatus Omnitrophica bacterium]|jgi:hypothetical protein|nr:hypothetical protein [Candidatus Omnitrophota bacterium]